MLHHIFNKIKLNCIYFISKSVCFMFATKPILPFFLKHRGVILYYYEYFVKIELYFIFKIIHNNTPAAGLIGAGSTPLIANFSSVVFVSSLFTVYSNCLSAHWRYQILPQIKKVNRLRTYVLQVKSQTWNTDSVSGELSTPTLFI